MQQYSKQGAWQGNKEMPCRVSFVVLPFLNEIIAGQLFAPRGFRIHVTYRRSDGSVIEALSKTIEEFLGKSENMKRILDLDDELLEALQGPSSSGCDTKVLTVSL
jgi:hypothetical protein